MSTTSAHSLSLTENATGWAAGQLDRAYYLQRLVGGKNRTLLFSKGFQSSLRGNSDIDYMSFIGKEYNALIEALADNQSIIPPEARETEHGAGSRNPIILWEDDDAQRRDKKKKKQQKTSTCCCGQRTKKVGGNTESLHTVPRVTYKNGSIRSPFAHVLPEGPVQTLRFLYVTEEGVRTPWGGYTPANENTTPLPPLPSSCIVILPATGEQGYGDRITLAKHIFESKRASSSSSSLTACILVMAPYYAARRPTYQQGYYASTVDDYQAQSMAIMTEAAWLLGWTHRFSPSANLVVTGFSWGAAMTACAGLLAAGSGERSRPKKGILTAKVGVEEVVEERLLPIEVARTQLAIVPYVGSCSPEPVITGVLHGDVDWKALARDIEKSTISQTAAAAAAAAAGAGAGAAGGGGGEGKGSEKLFLQRAYDELLNILRSSHTSKLVQALQEAHIPKKGGNVTTMTISSTSQSSGAAAAPSKTDSTVAAVVASTICVGMSHDHFLSLPFSVELSRLLGSISSVSEYRVFPGGHVSAYLNKNTRQVAAVIDALQQLSTTRSIRKKDV